MTSRDKHLLAARPTIGTTESTEMTAAEHFQNTTLRPILKLQHPLLVSIAEHQLSRRKVTLDRSNIAAYTADLEHWLKRDQSSRMQLITCVVAMMTKQELTYYHNHVSSTNRRITSMVTRRVVDALAEKL